MGTKKTEHKAPHKALPPDQPRAAPAGDAVAGSGQGRRQGQLNDLVSASRELTDGITALNEERYSLNGSWEKWHALTENTDDVIQILDPDGTIVYMNRVYPPHRLEDLLYKSVYDFIDPGARAAFEEALQNVVAGKGPQVLDVPVRLTDTETVFFETKWVGMPGRGTVKKIISVSRDVTARKQAEEKAQATLAQLEAQVAARTSELSERVKELNCLFEITRLFDQQETPLPETLRQVAGLICKAWQQPNHTCARITLDDMAIATDNFSRTPWMLSGDITLYDERIGTLEVGYLEDLTDSDAGPFLVQEKNLFDVIAKNLGLIISRKLMAEALKSKAARLEELNTALNTLLDKRQQDQADFANRYLNNLKLLIDPYLDKLALSNPDARQAALIDTIRRNLSEVSSSFSGHLTSPRFSLSPAELRVANLVKQGKSSADIARVLGISEKTVKNHRHKIREKVGINNERVNLRTFLMSLSS
jgi:PAS domain S-box-containing protein